MMGSQSSASQQGRVRRGREVLQVIPGLSIQDLTLTWLVA